MKIRAFTLRTLAIAACILFCFRAGAEEAGWLSDFNAALAAAKASHKSVLMDFTGSDWCPVCILMEKEVLSTPVFKEYAARNLVLMRVDFPEGKQPPQKVQDQNDELQKKYGVDGFPTFILVDSSGNVLGRTAFDEAHNLIDWVDGSGNLLSQSGSYLDGGPAAFIAKLQSIQSIKK